MNRRQRIFMYTIQFIAIIAAGLFVYMESPDERWLAAALCWLFGMIQVIRLVLLAVPLARFSSVAVIGLQFLTACVVQVIAGGFVPQTLFFVLIAELGYRAPRRFSFPFMLLSYTAFVGATAYHEDFPGLAGISFVLPRFIEYILFWGFSYLAQRSTQQRNELQRAYDRLRLYHREIEDKSIMQERLKLSRDIHDSAGHYLTTSMMALETAKRLLEKGEVEKARTQLQTSKHQVQETMKEIRKTAHSMAHTDGFIDLAAALEGLLVSTRDTSDVRVEWHFDKPLPVLRAEQEMLLYRMLQEGLTNGLRHGGCTYFSYTLSTQVPGQLVARLEDNGRTVTKNVSFGFGLRGLSARAEELGGLLRFEALPGGKNGMALELRLPVRDPSPYAP
ncbi:sensor histidine kinase [Marinococcus halophilus]|uniref:sensor histidine kinase n=1 Tax=Marinococcus halophilus TaxID=1371 RepID=UPI0009A7AD55|nr:histidine kinase [Marinococcus halophilus]